LGGIIHSFDEIGAKIESDKAFLANFNDEYFWYYLELYKPEHPVLIQMKDNLLTRTPMRLIREVRVLAHETEGPLSREYSFLARNLINRPEFIDCLSEQNISLDFVTVVDKKIRFEETPYSIRYTDEVTATERLKLVKIKFPDSLEDLLSLPCSIVKILSTYHPRIVRLYVLTEKDSMIERGIVENVAELCREFSAC
jgi:hypothetical protein